MPDTPGTLSFQATFGSMTDSQLSQTISQISNAASQTTYGSYRTPVGGSSYFDPKQWSSNLMKSTPSRARSRTTRTSTPANVTTTPIQTIPAIHHQQSHPTTTTTTTTPLLASTTANNVANIANISSSVLSAPIPTTTIPNPPLHPLPTTQQALYSTYTSRLSTGSTLLMQPILATTTSTTTGGTRTGTRRGGVVNYADPASGDDMDGDGAGGAGVGGGGGGLDAGAMESDDSDFVASGGTRSAIRATRYGGFGTLATMGAGGGGGGNRFINHSALNVSGGVGHKMELDQSYLGMIPPAKFITARRMEPTKHEYPSQTALQTHATRPTSLIPIRVELETETHRIRDCFVWNIHESLIKPETFARIFCADLELPVVPWVETVTNQIRAQIEEHEGVAGVDLCVGSGWGAEGGVEGGGGSGRLDGGIGLGGGEDTMSGGEPIPDCRVILSIDVQIATYHLLDHIEWDLLSPLTPEHFAQRLCDDLGLGGEAAPLVAHAVHEELLKHKKDAIEWGVIGAERDGEGVGAGAGTGGSANVENVNVNVNVATANATPGPEGTPAPAPPTNAPTPTPIPTTTAPTPLTLTTSLPLPLPTPIPAPAPEREKRDKSGLSLMKDKTGLGLGWGRTPRDGRGPKTLRSVWKDWAEAEEFVTRFEVLTAEEVEKREVERERASRRLRRETSKFQYAGVVTRRRR